MYPQIYRWIQCINVFENRFWVHQITAFFVSKSPSPNFAEQPCMLLLFLFLFIISVQCVQNCIRRELLFFMINAASHLTEMKSGLIAVWQRFREPQLCGTDTFFGSLKTKIVWADCCRTTRQIRLYFSSLIRPMRLWIFAARDHATCIWVICWSTLHILPYEVTASWWQTSVTVMVSAPFFVLVPNGLLVHI